MNNNKKKISYMRVRSMELLETESVEESLLSQTTKMHIDFMGSRQETIIHLHLS